MKKRIAVMIVSCMLLGQVCPFTISAEQIEQNTTTTDAVGAEEEVLISGDCSADAYDHVEWRVIKTPEEGKLKLIISGTGKMGKMGSESTPFVKEIALELLDLGIEDSYISDVEICEGVNNICDYAFTYSKIENVSLPNSLREIGYGSFKGCKKLKKVDIPDSVEIIDFYAFMDCTQLKEVVLPSKLECINPDSFRNTGITSVTIPEVCQLIMQGAFQDCKNLKEVVFPKKWEGIICGEAFTGCESITELCFPEGIQDLNNMIWWGCTNLKTVRLPHSLRSINGLSIPGYYGDGDDISDVYYEGTKKRWNLIHTLSEYEKKLIDDGKLTIHCQDGDIGRSASTEISNDEAVAMQRLYNPYSREHFYTNSTHERDVLVSRGWKYEGIGWYAPAKSKTPVYRLYNAFVNDHHYTTSSYEREVLIKKYGWIDEGIGWYSDDDKSVPLYRRYCPFLKSGAHHYTPALNEARHLLTVGWKDEGIAWYGIDPEKK